MALTASPGELAPPGGEHVVQFYERDDELACSVGSYLLDALLAGGVAIVVATPSHSRAFVEELSVGVDVGAAQATGKLVLLDAAETLASFTSRGRLNSEAFDRTVGEVVRSAASRGAPVHAYGEMVSLLWEAGDVLAAIELEEFWNSLAEDLRFSLMCGYRQSAVAGPEHSEALRRVCHLHTSVRHAREAPGTVEVEDQFPAEVQAPSAARRLLVEALDQAGRDDPKLSQDAQLLVSELVTNAVLHAGSSVFVGVRCERSSVRVSVRDLSPHRPTPSARGQRTGLGMGLRLVDVIATDWGIEQGSEGKTVWAELRS